MATTFPNLDESDITPISAVENPEVRAVLQHIKEMRDKDFNRYCALCDLLDMALNEALEMRERNIAVYLLNLDRLGHVDAWRKAYMDEHGGSDGTEENEKDMEGIKAQVLEALKNK